MMNILDCIRVWFRHFFAETKNELCLVLAQEIISIGIRQISIECFPFVWYQFALSINLFY